MTSQKVLISGGCGNLGSRLCEYLLERNFDVTLIGHEKACIVKKLTKVAKKNGCLISSFHVELTNFNINKTIGNLDQFDHIVINHASLLAEDILTITREDIHKIFQNNFACAFSIVQKALKKWKKKNLTKDKSFVFLSSVATKCGAENELAYHASKRALESLALSIARAFAKYNIRSNVVSPGLMNTKMGKEVLEKRPTVLERIPLNRLVSLEDVSATILHLIENTSITGQNIHVNCGRYFTI